MSPDTLSLYKAVFTANACGTAVTTLLVYDWCISLSSEVNLFWRAPRTSASLLYFFNRYCILLEWGLALITIQPVSDLSCRGLYYTGLVLALLVMLGPAFFSFLRVYALTGQHKVLSGLVLASALVPFFVNVSTTYQAHPVNLEPPYNCYLDSTTSPTLATILTFLSRSAPTLADLIVIAVTWRTTYKSSKLAAETIKGPSFHQVMLHNGSIYFVVLATLNILHIIMTALSFKTPSGSESYMINFIDPIASLLVCHFLISLQEAKQSSQPATARSLPSFVRADCDFGSTRSRSRIELPPFVASLAGPVHTVFTDTAGDEDEYASVPREGSALPLDNDSDRARTRKGRGSMSASTNTNTTMDYHASQSGESGRTTLDWCTRNKKGSVLGSDPGGSSSQSGSGSRGNMGGDISVV